MTRDDSLQVLRPSNAACVGQSKSETMLAIERTSSFCESRPAPLKATKIEASGSRPKEPEWQDHWALTKYL